MFLQRVQSYLIKHILFNTRCLLYVCFLAFRDFKIFLKIGLILKIKRLVNTVIVDLKIYCL